MTESPTRVSAGQTRRTVHIVPHTHWDREWYQSFQTFRLRLVDLLDDLLPQMEDDPAYARFLLDGQMAVVDDYLAVRPEAEEPLRRLVGSGRISMGPWYTLPDEFLVSGETLVRNLQRGLTGGRPVRRRHGGRLPARHVRPRRPDAPGPGRLRLRARRGVAGRARRRRPQRLLVGGARRFCGPGRVPARRATGTVRRCRTTPRPSSPPSTGSDVSGATCSSGRCCG